MSKSLNLLLLFALFTSITSLSHAQAGARTAPAGKRGLPSFEAGYAALAGLELDPAKVATVGGYMMERDVASFTLNEGKLYLCKPVAGRVRAALFVGKGDFNYTPPIAVERKQLARFFDAELLQDEFTTLFLYFADSTYEELTADLAFGPGELPRNGADLLEEALGLMGKEQGFQQPVIRPVLNAARSRLFRAHVGRARNPVIFQFDSDPEDQEEVTLWRRVTGISDRYRTELVNQFHKREDYEAGVEVDGDREDVEIQSYTIDTRISSGLSLASRAELVLRPIDPDATWACFSLDGLLAVDSMMWGNGARGTYFKAKDGSDLWVRLDQMRDTSERPSLRVWYHGDVLHRKLDWIFLRTSIEWYPSIGWKSRAPFDLTFRTPAGLKFASIGENISSVEEDDERVSRWVVREPTRNASFNIGPFSERTITSDSLPPITVYMTKTSHSAIEEGYAGGSNMDERVGDDVKNAMALFSYLYGPPRMKHFYVTETPYAHGEAFPGLIHLSASTFHRDDETGFDQLFRAHEVAHQWWPMGVDYRTYHDQWLSEAFAEYSGLIYMQAALKQNDKFFKMLRKYRDRLLNNRKSAFGSGQEAGPIWLGWRNESSSTDGDYDLITYQKGAWVLHMIRGLMLDNRTMKEDKFREMMRDFYQSFQGDEAGTEDFQKIVERHVGADMGWFFDQWVFGTAIPSYTVAHNIQKTPEGKYQVSIRVEQKNVPDGFRMYVPVKLDFGENRYIRDRILVTGPRTDVTLPLMPEEPEEVIFNDLEAVLCQVDEVSW